MPWTSWGLWPAGWYILASVVTVVAYAVDKRAAAKGRWRTREKTLHLLALAGGWPGALVAQRWLRHKTRKRGFQAVTWGIVAAHVVGWAFVLWRTVS
ncbi:MAG: DUF1294 domain-containing protein [Phycisphaerales bacterium JB039]